MKYIIIILITIYLHANMDDFEQFEEFENNDKQEFNILKSKAETCIKNFLFDCASLNISKMKPYINSKKDTNTIQILLNKLEDQKRKKIAQEEKARANKQIAIELKSCNKDFCTFYINGKEDGFINYNYSNNGIYNLYITYSKYAKSNKGFYDSKLHRVWSTRCQDSVYGQQNKKFVYKLKKAMLMFINCSINNSY